MENNRTSVIGYSGHSYVCIETAICNGIKIEGYYEIKEQLINPYFLTYLGNENNINQISNSLFIAIGNNSIRETIYKNLESKVIFNTLVHPNSIVSSTAHLADNVLVSAGAILNAQVKIETGAIINTGAIIEHECAIGAFAHIAPGTVIAGNVSVGERSFIGANSVIKQGVKIGKDVTVGAGSVILHDIPDYSTVVGNPGKIIKIKL
jgi:sugar O-acyltransferase (sialic acid O-acetyltransferase NeuD family)